MLSIYDEHAVDFAAECLQDIIDLELEVVGAVVTNNGLSINCILYFENQEYVAGDCLLIVRKESSLEV